MKVNARMFVILAAFFLAATVAYVIWSFAYESQGLATDPSGAEQSWGIEWVGSIALLLSAVFALLIGFYLNRTYRSQAAELPEDLDDADVDDGDPEAGFFSPWSWWPITLAAAIALLFLGLATGIWVSFGGVAVGLIAIVGWTYEYYRGFHSH